MEQVLEKEIVFRRRAKNEREGERKKREKIESAVLRSLESFEGDFERASVHFGSETILSK